MVACVEQFTEIPTSETGYGAGRHNLLLEQRGDYGEGAFERADFQRLADQLSEIAGQFILTVNATDGAREAFGRFAIEEVGTTYTVGTSHGGKRVTELIVRGQ